MANVDLVMYLKGFISSVTDLPLNIILTSLICIVLIYFTYKRFGDRNKIETQRKNLKPFPKTDMTLDELRRYDGKNDEGRVLLALNSEIYDVTKGGFYGPDAPYANLAGHDATRALATFDINAVKDIWDDYSDLSVQQMSRVTEWIEQFKEKYDYIGRLVRTEAEKSTPIGPTDEESDDEEVDEIKTKTKQL